MIISNVFYRISHTDIIILQKACKINIFLEKSCISFEDAEKCSAKKERKNAASFDLHRKSAGIAEN